MRPRRAQQAAPPPAQLLRLRPGRRSAAGCAGGSPAPALATPADPLRVATRSSAPQYPEADILTSSDNLRNTVDVRRHSGLAWAGGCSAPAAPAGLALPPAPCRLTLPPALMRAQPPPCPLTPAPLRPAAPLPQDEGLEKWPDAGGAANIGIMLFRPRAAELAQARPPARRCLGGGRPQPLRAAHWPTATAARLEPARAVDRSKLTTRACLPPPSRAPLRAAGVGAGAGGRRQDLGPERL